MAGVARQFLTNSQVSQHRPEPRWRGSALPHALALFRRWRQRSRQRGELARLDEQSLRDLGQCGGDVYREAAKWFWQE